MYYEQLLTLTGRYSCQPIKKNASFLKKLFSSTPSAQELLELRRKKRKYNPYAGWESEEFDPDNDEDYFYNGVPCGLGNQLDFPRLKDDATLADNLRLRLADVWGVDPASFGNTSNLRRLSAEYDYGDTLGGGFGYSVAKELGTMVPFTEAFTDPKNMNEFADALRPYIRNVIKNVKRNKAADKWLETASPEEVERFYKECDDCGSENWELSTL